MVEEQQVDLENFKQAIKNDHLHRLAELKSSIDDQLADIVISKRIKVEKQVEQIRAEHRSLLQSRLQRQELHVHQQVRNCLIQIHAERIALVEAKLKEKILLLREDTVKYEKVLNNLIIEGLQVIGKPSIIYLLKRDISLVHGSSEILDVRENFSDIWGGSFIEESGSGQMVIDNTFRTRWLKILPLLSERLTHEIDQIIGPTIKEFSRKLRIS